VRLLIALVFAGFGAITLSSQPSTPQAGVAFDVASIRANRSGSGRVSSDLSPAGRLTLTNVSVRELIRDAFRLRDVQIVGGAPEILRERFDIVANAGARATAEQVKQMTRTLLVERFHLVTHGERRELPVYELLLARSDGQLGPRLRPRSDCAGRPPDTEPPRDGRRACGGVLASPGRVMAQGMRLEEIGFAVERIIVDRTGLSGYFDLELEYTPDQLPPAVADLPRDLPPIPRDGPSIFTALQEQLGLKLQPSTAPLDVLVIDSVASPTPD
jgi:uncharacterized protein (TIGR03435 family)